MTSRGQSDLLALLTDSDLDVVSSGGVFEVVDGAQHVQGHVADVVRVKGRLVGNARHHHVGVANRLHLDRKRGIFYLKCNVWGSF